MHKDLPPLLWKTFQQSWVVIIIFSLSGLKSSNSSVLHTTPEQTERKPFSEQDFLLKAMIKAQWIKDDWMHKEMKDIVLKTWIL